MATDFCWEGQCVRYGILLDNGDPISQGRFRCSDVDALPSRFTLQETTPEEVGLSRESDECSAFNDWLFPPEFPPPIPPRLILEVKNNVTDQDIAPINVRFELVPNPEIDRVAIVKVIWDFGDGSPLVTEEGLFGQRIGFIQNHTYQQAVNFNGTVTLQILDSARNVLDEETQTFSGIVLSEPFFVPLEIIVDRSAPSGDAPLGITLSIIGNQAIENIVVEWGDGTPPEVTSQSASHIYETPGNFTGTVSAQSRLSGEIASQTFQITVTQPALPPEEIPEEPIPELPEEPTPPEEPIPPIIPEEPIPEIPPEELPRTTLIVFGVLAAAAGIGIAIAATRKS